MKGKLTKVPYYSLTSSSGHNLLSRFMLRYTTGKSISFFALYRVRVRVSGDVVIIIGIG